MLVLSRPYVNMEKIKIYEGKKVHEIKFLDISHFMAMGKKTQVMLNNKKIIISNRLLKFYHDQLHIKKDFYRIHRKYLINFHSIVGMQKGNKIFYAKDGFKKGYTILPSHIN